MILSFEARRQRFLAGRLYTAESIIRAFGTRLHRRMALREELANAYYEGGQARVAIQRAKRRKTK